jgi:hypothetical protein
LRASTFFLVKPQQTSPDNALDKTKNSVIVDQLALQLVIFQIQSDAPLIVLQDVSAKMDTLETAMANVFFQLNARVSGNNCDREL